MNILRHRIIEVQDTDFVLTSYGLVSFSVSWLFTKMSIDRIQQAYLLHFYHNLECIETKKYSFGPLCSFYNVTLICRIFRNYMLTCYSQNYFYHSNFLLSQVLHYHNLQTWLETSVSLDFEFSLPYIPIPMGQAKKQNKQKHFFHGYFFLHCSKAFKSF